eukprot:scaffold105971_cov63-Phaeocystis_antarctica.AAC.7
MFLKSVDRGDLEGSDKRRGGCERRSGAASAASCSNGGSGVCGRSSGHGLSSGKASSSSPRPSHACSSSRRSKEPSSRAGPARAACACTSCSHCSRDSVGCGCGGGAPDQGVVLDQVHVLHELVLGIDPQPLATGAPGVVGVAAQQRLRVAVATLLGAVRAAVHVLCPLQHVHLRCLGRLSLGAPAAAGGSLRRDAMLRAAVARHGGGREGWPQGSARGGGATAAEQQVERRVGKRADERPLHLHVAQQCLLCRGPRAGRSDRLLRRPPRLIARQAEDKCRGARGRHLDSRVPE